MSIRLRLTLWYSAVLAVTLVAFGVAIYLFVNYNTFSEIKARVKEQAMQIQITPTLDFWDRLDLKINPYSIQDQEMFIQLVNYKEGVIRRTDNLLALKLVLPYPQLKERASREAGYEHITVSKYPFVVYMIPIANPNTHETVGMLQVAAYAGSQVKFLDELRTTLIFASIAVVLIAFTIGLFLARQALRPIEGVIRATNQIQNGSDLSVRIPRIGPNDEMGRLTDTLNGMLGRLELTYNGLDELYKAQRRFVSDASHELRTPLTTIRGNIELLERMWLPSLEIAEENEQNRLGSGGQITEQSQEAAQRTLLTKEAMQDIADEAKRMSGLVNDLLALARADAGYEMEKTQQPLLPLVEDVARRAQLLPRKAEWRIGNLEPLEGVEVHAHGDYLRQLFFIFVENAFKYTESGYVEISALRTSDGAGVVIKDTGIGMNSDEIPHIFERFYRADLSRGQTSGTGLGLSIAKWIIDEHDGSVEVTTKEGNGTTFIVWLPVAFQHKSNGV
ncbi:HAMP domain-containing histidine kinase [Paenibacillus oenotherae]|uniref:histidine kinase n=1 Tax=Paenibacillus oenotherae TaxID=1435645 RepID=A0ABS7D4A0_9BACL|nr:HAMP domain-containing sensor histidine kinase [Paenibacillus oenotherae]MBW7474626.1 HAMP domain-containing histidine kinase [Paenibacillus oenotherae]